MKHFIPKLTLSVCIAGALAYPQQPMPRTQWDGSQDSGIPGRKGTASDSDAPASASARKMAQLPKREVDPNFDFKDADYALLSECGALDNRYAREGMIFSDPDLQAYLDKVGRSILPSTTPPANVSWRFLALRDPVANALSLPNGSVYINTGLLAMLDNESQLAAVLAHEITHVTGRHLYIANRSYRKKALTISLIQMGAHYSPYGTTWGASVRLAADVIPGVLESSIVGYRRELEREADLYAIEKLSNAGYDPSEMINVFHHLEDTNEVEVQTLYYNDHPKLQDRVEYVSSYLATKKGTLAGPFPVQPATYREKTQKAIRADVQLALASNRPRTANAIARRLLGANPLSAENLIALADTYRALGPWAPKPQAEELSNHAKKELAKARAKLTPEEEEEKLRESPEGEANLAENAR